MSGATPDRVAALDIGAGGALTPVSGSPYATGAEPGALAVTPDGRRVYVVNSSGASVSAFDVAASGGLTQIPGSPFGVGDGPRGLAIGPDGRFLYVANSGADSVSAFAIGAGGGLTAVSGSPFGAGDAPFGIAITPDGTRLYVANQAAGTVQGFAVGATGALTPFSGAPAGVGFPPSGLAVAPDGGHLYVAGANSGLGSTQGFVRGYAISADGALSPLAGPATSAENGTGAIAISPGGDRLYVANAASNDISSFAIAADGTLTPGSGSPIAAGTRPRGLALTPDGLNMFSSADNGALLFPAMVAPAFTVEDTGALSAVSGSPFDPGMSGQASFANVATTPNQGPVASFTFTLAPPQFPSTFDASASADGDGTIVRYDWDFGDGTVLPDGGPAPTHIYRGLAAYTVTLTVTDNEGCSTTVVFTGQTASCNGGTLASQARIADLDPPRITVGGKRIQRLDRVVEIRVSADEPVLAIAKGQLTVRRLGTKRRRRTRGNVSKIRIKPAGVVVAPGAPGTLKMKLSRRALRVARTALEHGGKAAMIANVSGFDAGSNEDVQTIRVQLRLGRRR